MAILFSAIGAVALLAPQQLPTDVTSTSTTAPAATSASGDRQPFIHARAFPENTALLLTWNANAGAPWQRVLETLPPQVTDSMPRMLEKLAQLATLTNRELATLRRGSYSFGLLSGPSSSSTPNWLLVGEFDEGASEEAIAVLQRLTGFEEEDDAQRVWTKESDSGEAISFGRLDGWLFAAPDPTLIDAALARVEDSPTKTRSVGDSLRFGRFLEQCGDDGTSDDAFAAAYVDLIGILDTVQTFVPPEYEGTFRNSVQALQLRQIFALGYIAHDVDGAVFEHSRICFPEPRSGLPSLFTVAPTRIDESLANFVPADAASFTLFHMDTDRLLEEALVLIQAVNADFGAQARALVNQFGQSNNVDIQEDVLSALGRRVAAIQWPSQSTTDEVLVWSLRNPLKIGKALRETRQFKTSVIDGFEIYRHGSGLLTIAVGDDDLLLSSSETRLQTVIDNWRQGVPNANVADLIARAPAGTTALSWTDTATLLQGALSFADEYDQGLPAGVRSELEGVLTSLGHANTTITADQEGLSIRSRSRFGAPGIVALLGLTAGISVAGEADPNFALSSPNRRAEFAWRLGELSRALAERPATTTLTSLADSGALDERVFAGEWVGLDNEYLVSGYRVRLIRDESDPSQFALAAWPDNERRGDVFCCTRAGVPMVNEVLTHSAGIARLGVRDVFRDGSLTGSRFATGWELVDLVQQNGGESTRLADGAETSTAGGTVVELTGSDWTTYQTIVAAEQGNLDLDAKQLVELVRHPNPAVAARAAHAIGVLDKRDAIPALCEVALELPHLTPARQVMQTLYDLRDPRVATVARLSLTHPDRKIRTLAAAMVGRAKDGTAVQGLLDLLLRKEPSPKDLDRVQALLSLADLGDPDCIETAAGCPLAGDVQEQALAYMLQELSPKLGGDREVAALLSILGHDSMIVRRYAIQRLGELRDPISVTALEHHLANEGPELRPLVEVALSAVRGPMAIDDSQDRSSEGGGAAGAANAVTKGWRKWVAKAKTWVRGLDKRTRNLYLAGSTGAALLFLGLAIIVLRRRRRAHMTDWAAMAAPSEGSETDEDETRFVGQSDSPYANVGDGVLDETESPVSHDEFYDDHAAAINVSDDFGSMDLDDDVETIEMEEINEWGPPSR